MGKKKARFKRKYTYHIGFFIFTLICIFTGIVCFQYYYKLQKTIQEEGEGYLQEIASRIGSNISRTVNDNYAVLDTLVSIIEKTDLETFDEIEPIVESQQSYWNCNEIMLIGESGDAYTAKGKKVVLNSDDYFTSTVIDKRKDIYTTQMINDEECIMLVVPINDIMVDNKKMVAMAATYDPASFEQTLSMSAFSDQAFSCIINKSGTLIVRSATLDDSLKLGYNVLTTIESSKHVEVGSIEQMKKEIKNDIKGQIVFKQGGLRYYAIYTPIDPEDWYLMTFVPVSVVNEKSDMLLKVTLVLCGLVALVFMGLLGLLWVTFYRNKRKLERIAYVDEITQGNTIQKFYLLSEQFLQGAATGRYALVYTNFKKFKVMNEQFGRSACDSILKAFQKTVGDELSEKECIGRISADNFCVLLQYKDEESLLKRFEAWYMGGDEFVAIEKPVWNFPITEFGVFVINNDDLSFPQMIDRAKLALRESARFINSKLCYAVYDDGVRQQMIREKQLEDMMDIALKNKEFKVFLQPKYHLPDEKIKGAEALTRWVSESEGMIFPDEFIPLFEKNGFIIQLDLYVFEEVCRKLREWLDQGYAPVKVSVNCSRAHLKNPHFLKDYRSRMEKYNIPEGLLEIELTESLVMGDTKRLIQVIEEIRSLGMGCSMDDFGSGYSSLNLIQSIPVDTLKLDKIFFRSQVKDSDRMESVVGCIVTMAKALSIETVAEGVEYEEQVEMLKKIGCDYIQGYVFAKPMPIPEFEELAFREG